MTARQAKRNKTAPLSVRDYDGLLSKMIALIEEARRSAARTVNTIITATYWEVGRRIVENEQAGRRRAGYGEALLTQLAADLTATFGRGFSRQNLQQMRQFYSAYPAPGICQTLSGKSGKRQTASGKWPSEERKK